MSEISEEATRLIDEFEYAVEDAVSDYMMACGASYKNQARYNLEDYIAELEAAQRWVPVSERLPDGGHREFYEVACIYQYFGELALFSKGRWVIYEGENEYDVSDSVMFWRKRQYLPDEVIAILSKGKMKPEAQE